MRILTQLALLLLRTSTCAFTRQLCKEVLATEEASALRDGTSRQWNSITVSCRRVCNPNDNKNLKSLTRVEQKSTQARQTRPFHGLQFRPVLCRGEPSVVRESVHGSVKFGWLQVQIDGVFHHLGRSSLLPYPFCLVDIAGFQLEMSFVPRPSRWLPMILACFHGFSVC